MQTPPTIACCLCGKPTPSDVAVEGRCLACLTATVDLTEGIEKECEVEMCKLCAQSDVYRWYRNPQWVVAELESAELLSLCVRRVKGLKAVRLVDASWIWQEPHSRRLKLKLTVARDVLTGRTLQQSFIVNFVVKTRMCTGCTKLAANDSWQSKVQLRQRADHPRTLLAMEHEMRRRQQEVRAAVDIKRTKEGLDFTFQRRQQAQRFVNLLHSIAPCRTKASASVVAANAKTGTSNVKHTWAVEVAPCCRGDLLLLPKALAGHTAPGASRWALVTHVGAALHLVDPLSGLPMELSAEAYWRHEAHLGRLAGREQLTTYVVLDIEEESTAGGGVGTAEAVAAGGAVAGGTAGVGAPTAGATATGDGAIGRGGPWVATDATVARERDFGANDDTAFVRTHLGGRLASGDEAFGYDLEAMAHVEEEDAPSVVLVEKKVDRKKSRAKRGSGSARRRRRKEGGGADDSSFVTTTSYQTEMGDVLDDLSIDGEEDASELAAMGEAFGDFVRDLDAPADDETDSVAASDPRDAGSSEPTVIAAAAAVASAAQEAISITSKSSTRPPLPEKETATAAATATATSTATAVATAAAAAAELARRRAALEAALAEVDEVADLE